MFSPPKEMLVDSFEYEEYMGVDRNHAAKYGEKKTIEYVRIDRSAVYSRNASESVKVADGTIYCYAAHTFPMVDFKLQSRVTFDNVAYTVTDVRAFTEPYSNQLTAYELEVVR